MPAKIVNASYPGHDVHLPSDWRAPFIFASPHSGRDYPTRFIDQSVLDLVALRRSEDAYVDTLLPTADSLGIPVIMARFPRAFVDVNRSPREIDPFMFTGSPIDGVEVRSSRVLAGYGAIPRHAAEAKPIYAGKLSAAEGRRRMKWCYTAYHDALQDLIETCLARFGHATLVDWHSMPASAGGQGNRLADLIFGDRYGASCDAATTQSWAKAFGDRGYSHRRNTPYAGGYVASLYGQPERGVDVLQIEINRALYLDERRVVRVPADFDALKSDIADICADLIAPSTITDAVAAE